MLLVVNVEVDKSDSGSTYVLTTLEGTMDSKYVGWMGLGLLVTVVGGALIPELWSLWTIVFGGLFVAVIIGIVIAVTTDII